MDTKNQQELIQTLLAVKNGEMTLDEVIARLTVEKRGRGRPKGMTTSRLVMRHVFVCMYILIRDLVKTNDDAFRLIGEIFHKSESEVKKAVIGFLRYDPFPEVWFRKTEDGHEMVLADIKTRNRIRWDWMLGVPTTRIHGMQTYKLEKKISITVND